MNNYIPIKLWDEIIYPFPGITALTEPILTCHQQDSLALTSPQIRRKGLKYQFVE